MREKIKRLGMAFLLLTMIFVFSACEAQAIVNAKVVDNEIKIYSDQECVVELKVFIQNGNDKDSYHTEVEVKAKETKIVKISEFSGDYYSEKDNPEITEIQVGKVKETMNDAIAIVMSIGLVGVIFLFAWVIASILMD